MKKIVRLFTIFMLLVASTLFNVQARRKKRRVYVGPSTEQPTEQMFDNKLSYTLNPTVPSEQPQQMMQSPAIEHVTPQHETSTVDDEIKTESKPSEFSKIFQDITTEHAQDNAPRGDNMHEDPGMDEEPDAQDISIDEDAPEEAEPEIADIYFNFENTNLSNFANYIAELRNINIIPDKGLAANKISLSIRKPLTPSGAWNVFETIIEMAGFSVINVGEVYKIVPKAQKLRQALQAYINVPLEELPKSDENIRYITFLENINVRTIKDLVASMLGVPNAVIDQQNVNGLIITARSNDIRSAMKVIKELDQTGLQESVEVIRLKQANARDVKELFDSLMQKPKGHPLARLLGKQAETSTAYFPPTTKIIAEERTNSLILLGNMKSIAKIEKFIIENIDTELKEVESPLHIYELEYADATQVMEILQHVTSPQELETQAGQQAAKHGAVRGGVKYFKNMKFKVDKDGNRLIVSSTDKQDWQLLEKTIQDLDKAQPQVAIETLIVTVNVDDTKQLGAQVRNKKHGQLGKHVDFQAANLTRVIPETGAAPASNPVSLLGNLISALTGEIGSTVLTFGKAATGGVWGAFQMLKELTSTSVLSQPFITVANKATSEISVGETRRIPVQQAVGDDGTISSNAATGFETKKVETKLQITPQINIDGIIKFDIKISVENFVGEIGDTQVRHLRTGATVADGQVLALGGFVRTRVTESTSRTPVLNRIPILGWFFKSKRRLITKDYIFVFMCPTILKPRVVPGLGLYTKMKLHDATDFVEEAIETRRINDPIHNWFFNPKGENYSHKVVDFANARYQPTTVDIANDPYYRTLEEINNKTNHMSQLFDGHAGEKEDAGKTAPEDKDVQVAPLPIVEPAPPMMPSLQAPESFEPAPQIPDIPMTELDRQLNKKREQLKQMLAVQPTLLRAADAKAMAPMDANQGFAPATDASAMAYRQDEQSKATMFKDFVAYQPPGDE